ncbi:MAG: HipA domain-containing protein [Gemmatimonadaceae bacterium]|nr:HipA domain-containing protein [Gemmatimonadaceae bacterium]
MARKKALGYNIAAPVLGVFMHETRIGTLGQHGSDVWFRYDDWVIDDATPLQWRLSIKLPIQTDSFGHEPTLVFFDNLLIESDTRAALAAATKQDASDVPGLLGRVGGECAGAVSLWPIDMEPPAQHQYRPISESELEEIFSERYGERLASVQLESRQVMSGVQHKLVVRKVDGTYLLPLAGAPSTAILKRSTGRYQDLAANELLCLKVVEALRLAPASASVIGGSNGLLEVTRYDRTPQPDGTISRIHQEDFCQATGRIVARKYQQSGGPGLGDIAEVLRRYSANPPEDIKRLIGVALANVCLGNMDAHAKNFSILYRPDGPRLAPFYDVVCTEAYAGLDAELSMKFGHAIDPSRISGADFERLAKDLKVARRAVDEEAERIAGVLSNELDSLVSEVSSQIGATAILDKIGDIVRRRIGVISAALSRGDRQRD